eukprot:11203938-Lingulodinium_polyedra.AAC.1
MDPCDARFVHRVRAQVSVLLRAVWPCVRATFPRVRRAGARWRGAFARVACATFVYRASPGGSANVRVTLQWMEEILPVTTSGQWLQETGGKSKRPANGAKLAPLCNVDWQNFLRSATLVYEKPNIDKEGAGGPRRRRRVRHSCLVV